MKPLPDLSNASLMAEIGRRSAIGQARKEVCEELRDVAVSVQSLDIWTDDVSKLCNRGRVAIDRLEALAELVKGQ